MPQSLQHQETVGNIPDSALLQGWTFPVPDDDIMSCEGSEGPNTGTIMEEPSFAEASCELAVRRQRQWVCRDASGSDATQGHSVVTCAGDKPHATTAIQQRFGDLHTNHDGDKSHNRTGGFLHHNFDEHPRPLQPVSGTADIDRRALWRRQFKHHQSNAYSSEATNYAGLRHIRGQSKCKVLRTCTLEDFHLGLRPSPGDQHAALGRLAGCSPRIFRHRRGS